MSRIVNRKQTLLALGIIGVVVLAVEVHALRSPAPASAVSQGGIPAAEQLRAATAIHAFTGQAVVGGHWELSSTPAGQRLEADIPQLGIFQVDTTSFEVTSATFVEDPAAARQGMAAISNASEPMLTATEELTAENFAKQHFAGFADLVQRSAKAVSHGSYSLAEFQWQARMGEAWLPTFVDVELFRASGKPAGFTSERIPLLISTTPLVMRDQAIQKGLAVASFKNATIDGADLIVIVQQSGRQVLVWQIIVTGHDKSVPFHQGKGVNVDALTGTAEVVAVSG